MYKNIPEEMKTYPNWVCWVAEKLENGRVSKKPINPKTGGYAQSNNPETWVDYETALRESESYSGIGFVLSSSPFFWRRY